MYILNLEEDKKGRDIVIDGHKPRFWAKINGSFLKNQKEDASGNNHVLDHSLFCAAQKSKPAFLVQKQTFHEGIQHV